MTPGTLLSKEVGDFEGQTKFEAGLQSSERIGAAQQRVVLGNFFPFEGKAMLLYYCQGLVQL